MAPNSMHNYALPVEFINISNPHEIAKSHKNDTDKIYFEAFLGRQYIEKCI